MIKKKIDQKDWARKAHRALLREADKWTKHPIEGSTGYHFFALQALATLMEVAPNFGYDLAGEPKLKAMFGAPLSLALPSGELPALNDSTFASIVHRSTLMIGFTIVTAA